MSIPSHQQTDTPPQPHHHINGNSSSSIEKNAGDISNAETLSRTGTFGQALPVVTVPTSVASGLGTPVRSPPSNHIYSLPYLYKKRHANREVIKDGPRHRRLRHNPNHPLLVSNGMARRGRQERLHRQLLLPGGGGHGDHGAVGARAGQLVRVRRLERVRPVLRRVRGDRDAGVRGRGHVRGEHGEVLQRDGVLHGDLDGVESVFHD